MVCEYCGYEMVEGLIICPNCLKDTPNMKRSNVAVKWNKNKKNNGSNKKNDEINQWFDMGLF